MVQIPFMQVFTPAATSWIAIVIVVAILIALLAVGVVIRCKRRTAATVASILKQNPPVY
ncbi:MAG: hypothetical protein NWE98_02695 [Candidatus Bathyarchaeota archaeon]|nr:hypothetical protein [Candidatus Bathyarchaeota archaeon]